MPRQLQTRLRLGVIGLGRLWESVQKPALAALVHQFEVLALFDQVARRAEREAEQIKCRAIHGLSALVADPAVDAVLWLAPQWFGSHPLTLVWLARKPIFCAVDLPADLAELDRLEARLAASDSLRAYWRPDLDQLTPGGLTFAEKLAVFQSWVVDLERSAPLWTVAQTSLRDRILTHRLGLADLQS